MTVAVMMTEVVDSDCVDDADDAVGDGEDCNDRNTVDDIEDCNDNDGDRDAVDHGKMVVGIVRQ